MMLASQPHSPIKSLILNDIGMIVPSTPLQRIEHMHARNMNFQVWKMQSVIFKQCLLQPVLWILKNGIISQSMEPLLLTKKNCALLTIRQLAKALGHARPRLSHFETYWQAIHCPIFLLFGEDSDFLSQDIITKMLYLQPTTKVTALPDCGHAPSLMEPEQIHLVEEWLECSD